MGFSRQEYGVGCNDLLKGFSPILGLDWPLLHLLHWPAVSLPLAPPGKSHNLVHQSDGIFSALRRNELSSHERTWRNFKCIFYHVQETDLKRLHAVEFQLHDILEKAIHTMEIVKV